MLNILTPEEAARKLSITFINSGYKPEALHTYADEEGNIIYWRIRLKNPAGAKWIRPMFRNEDDEFILGEPPMFKEKLKTLYGLHLLKLYPNATVFVIEGEMPADILNKFFKNNSIDSSYIAVTSGGATSANATDWEPLSKRNCVIWPDFDAPGFEYAKQVQEKLIALGCSIKRINVESLGLPEKSDCVDYLEATPSATITDILDLCQHDEVNNIVDDNLDATINRLSQLSELEYEQIRLTESKRLNIRATFLDKLVKEANGNKTAVSANDGMPFPIIEPWHEPINPDELLTEIFNVIKRFIICHDETACAATLWICMTWFINQVQVAPLAVITAPEKRCGKSQLLFLLGRLVNRPMAASNITPAALFRSIDAWQPTLLIDEADVCMAENDELKGLLNCGHTRESAFTVRVVGDDFVPKKFYVFGAKALAGIGNLADTIMDRAIKLKLRRKKSTERTERLRHAEGDLFNTLASKLARFSQDSACQVQAARPELPEALNDRAQDNWEPLLAIADIAGNKWAELARNSALKLSNTENEIKSIGAQLLADIFEIFESKRIERIFTKDLINYLCEDEEKIWATYNRGKRVSHHQLSKKLKEFGIEIKNIRIGISTNSGVEREYFKDAFEAYLGIA